MPWATPDYSADNAQQWMNAARAAGQHSFVIRDPDGTVVGICGLVNADAPNRCIQLGYWTGENHTGRGYATRAARLVIGHALGDLEFHRVEILVSVQNRPSQRVAERLGGRLEATLTERLDVRGSWHDAFLYAVVA
jgi:RimJ/RimL family protein N-acetyltransferase